MGLNSLNLTLQLLAAHADPLVPRLRLHPPRPLRHPLRADVPLRVLLLHRRHHRRAVSQ